LLAGLRPGLRDDPLSPPEDELSKPGESEAAFSGGLSGQPRPGQSTSPLAEQGRAQTLKPEGSGCAPDSALGRGSEGGAQPVKLSRSLRLLQAAKDIAYQRAEAEKRAAQTPLTSPLTSSLGPNQRPVRGVFEWSDGDSPPLNLAISGRERAISGQEKAISGRDKVMRRRPLSLDEITRENTRLNSCQLVYPRLPPVPRKKKRRRTGMRAQSELDSANEPTYQAANHAVIGCQEVDRTEVGSLVAESTGTADTSAVLARLETTAPADAIDTSPDFEPAAPDCVKSGTPPPDLSPSPVKAIPFSLSLDLTPSPEKTASDDVTSDGSSDGTGTEGMISNGSLALRKESSVKHSSTATDSPLLKGPVGFGSPLRISKSSSSPAGSSRRSDSPKRVLGFSGGTLKGSRFSWDVAAAVNRGKESLQPSNGSLGVVMPKGILKKRSSLSSTSSGSVSQHRFAAAPQNVEGRTEEAGFRNLPEGELLTYCNLFTRGGMQCSVPQLAKTKRRLLKCRPWSAGYGQSVEMISGNDNDHG
jgi:hypothetical protein